ncbi:MAG: aspartate aminotransferase family protein [Deltaproteobacteria bacterium]|nr:aspartate aminotransferase family protein [Deltaproteobacteria bacterium]
MIMNGTEKMELSPKKKQMLAKFGTHVSRGQIRFLSAGHLDIFEGKRKGVHFYESVTGKRYVDGFSSAGCFNVGRGNPEILDELRAAVRDGSDMGSAGLLSRHKVEFAKKLVQACPGDLNRVIFAGSGADAVDGAIKLALGATGRTKILSMVKAYHGHSGFSLSANGKAYYKELFEPLMPNFDFLPFGDLNAFIRKADTNTAAVILEPIQGEGGIHVASDEYLAGLRKHCDNLGIQLIFDEIQTGFGRTGKLWASEHSGVVPDIMVLAKAIGGGIYPNGAIVYRDTPVLTDFTEKNPWFHVSLGGGSDIGCRISSKVLDYILENRLWENAERMGGKIRNGLLKLQEQNPEIILEVRGRGMMMGLEYKHDFMGMLMAECLSRKGMFAAYSGNAPQVMRFQIPLTLSESETDEVISIIEEALKIMKLYLILLMPLSRLPLIGRVLNNQKVLISSSAFLRKFGF